MADQGDLETLAEGFLAACVEALDSIPGSGAAPGGPLRQRVFESSEGDLHIVAPELSDIGDSLRRFYDCYKARDGVKNAIHVVCLDHVEYITVAPLAPFLPRGSILQLLTYAHGGDYSVPPVKSLADLPDVAWRNSILSRQFSRQSGGGSDLSNLISGEFCSTSTMHVLHMSYGFQMFRTNTHAVVAKVIYLQPPWDRAKRAFVSYAMRRTAASESAIPLTVHGSSPDKAHRGESAIAFLPQIFTPDETWLHAGRVSLNESAGAALKKIGELSASAFAELPTRLKTHVGLLVRLTLGGRTLPASAPRHLIGSTN